VYRHSFSDQIRSNRKTIMSSPTASGSGFRRSRYTRSPSGGGVPPSKRSKPSGSADPGNGSDHHRPYTSICVKNINPKIPDLGK
jgi:hypothetical protein